MDYLTVNIMAVSLTFHAHPLILCSLLVNCETPYVQFIAASTICEALVREWATLSHDQVDSLQTFMLSVIVQKPRYGFALLINAFGLYCGLPCL